MTLARLVRLAMNFSVSNYVSNQADRATFSESQGSRLPGGIDGPADVYRHLLISAELTRQFGRAYAEDALQGYERWGAIRSLWRDDRSSTPLDEYINPIGLQLG
jgi:hypothetical protein